MKWLLGLLAFGVVGSLPIFRGAGHSRHDGVTLWQLLHDSSHLTPDSPFGHPHLPYEEAVRRAHEAWLEHIGEIRA